MDNINIEIKGILASIKELRESQADTDRQLKESIAGLTEKQAETDNLLKRSIAASDKRGTELSSQIKDLKESVNGISKSNGMIAEEFFFTAIDMGGKNFFGEQFDECYSYVKRNSKAKQLMSELDIILFNGKSVALVEVKYRARKEDIQKMIDKLPKFRILYPEHKERRIYLGMAAMAFDKGVEDESEKEGIAIFKQLGDTVVINDKYLKVF